MDCHTMCVRVCVCGVWECTQEKHAPLFGCALARALRVSFDRACDWWSLTQGTTDLTTTNTVLEVGITTIITIPPHTRAQTDTQRGIDHLMNECSPCWLMQCLMRLGREKRVVGSLPKEETKALMRVLLTVLQQGGAMDSLMSADPPLSLQHLNTLAGQSILGHSNK